MGGPGDPRFPPWLGRFPGPGVGRGATVVFPHAGGAVVNYRTLAMALAAGGDTYVVQYPRRADRFREPPAETVHDLAADLFEAAPWSHVAPLRLFGHSMGALVAFEFARIAEKRGVTVQKLWASASPAPSSLPGMPQLPTDDDGLLADLAELGGTDPRLFADKDFTEIVLAPVRADYQAFNRYQCEPDTTINADIHVIGGREDHRVDTDLLARWAEHTAGAFGQSFYDGGHFYLYEHVNALAAQVQTDAR